MNNEINLLLGILIGISLFSLMLLLFRDIIISRFLNSLTVVPENINSPNLDKLREDILHNLELDMSILLDNKNAITTLLSLSVELNSQDIDNLNKILDIINNRIKSLESQGIKVKDN